MSEPRPDSRVRRLAALEALRNAVAARRGAGQAQARATRDDTQLRSALERLEASQEVNPHLPIGWPTWPPGVAPKLTAIVQKVVRRMLRWYINPIVAQQNEFNRATADTATALREALSSLADDQARIAARMAELE